MTKAQLLTLRNRLFLHDEIPEEDLDADLPPYYRPAPDSKAGAYLAERAGPGRTAPRRVVRAQPLPAAGRGPVRRPDGRIGDPAVSTTMAFARLLRSLVRDPSIGHEDRPHRLRRGPDLRARVLDQRGADLCARGPALHAGRRRAGPPLRREQPGQVLQEGISEAGAIAAFTAAATSYATWGEPMIPFYLFYSMFGFQRVGDLLWALGDVRGRGFLLGCTAGRTTLNGEGLQHQDGHSLLLASTVPSVAAYDPAFSYEVAAIVEDGILRMTGPEPEDRIWYLTLYNENYPMPALPADPDEAERVRVGLSGGCTDSTRTRQLRASIPTTPRSSEPAGDRTAAGRGRAPGDHPVLGSAWQAAVEAGRLLAVDWGVDADLWSVTSYKSLREDAISAERWNRLHPGRARAGPVRDRVPGPVRRTGRGRDRLHAVRARPGVALGAPPFHVPRHRRVRTVGHEGRAPQVLRGGRGPRGGGRAERPGGRRPAPGHGRRRSG
jgi:pyruvate dehydrogenase E1 component